MKDFTELTTLPAVTICKDDFEALLPLWKEGGIFEQIIILTTSRSEEAMKMFNEYINSEKQTK